MAAVVEYYGGLIPPLRERARQMPPTLILHGAKDAIIPLSEATDLDKLLTSYGRPHEIHIYPDAGHGFNFHGNGVSYDRDAASDAWTRALEFLDRTFLSIAVSRELERPSIWDHRPISGVPAIRQAHGQTLSGGVER